MVWLNNKSKQIALCLVLSVSVVIPLSGAPKNIVPQTGAIRNCVRAVVSGEEMVYISEENGTVSLNNLAGKTLWRNMSDNPAVMFEIIAHDLDGDKQDDLLGVSGNGSVYAWKSDGKLLWKFTTPEISRLSEIAVVGEDDETRIFAGGNNFKIYELDSNGNLLSFIPIKGTVRILDAGYFVQNGKKDLFVLTYSHDKFRSEYMGFIDSVTKKEYRSSSISKFVKNSTMITDNTVADIDNDGKDDVILFGASETAEVVAFNADFRKLLKFSGSKDKQRYAHTKGTVLSPLTNEIVFQYGGIRYLIDFKGKQLEKYGERSKGVIFNNLVFMPDSKMLLGAGQVSGDNTLYVFNLGKSGWMSASHEYDGLYAEVRDNLNKLYHQALNFKLPAYQKKKEKPFISLGLDGNKAGRKDVWLKGFVLDEELEKLNGGNLFMVSTGVTFSESTSRDDLVAAIGKDALKKDKRMKYNMTPDEIVEWARRQEEKGEPFQMWVGHGNDPFYVRINTLEKILEVAPKTCYGFIYAEMNGTSDPRIKYFVDEYIPRIATAIRKNNSPTKVYFRYKNMFWAGDAHEELWSKVFFSGKYSDIIVPSAEDTNNRLQDLNFTGRVGMYLSGYVDDYSMRLVDDNPTSWRPLSPGGQTSVSPYLRNAALMAAYGCSHGVLFPIQYLEWPGYNIFFALIKSGLIPMLNRDEILSVNSWHLVKDIDVEYLERVNNSGHNLTLYRTSDDDAVVGKAGVHWCGTSVTDYDYSKLSLGVDYRWLNFIPPMPYGIVPITSYDYEDKIKKSDEKYVVSDLHHGIVNGKKIPARVFGDIMSATVKECAKKLPITVEGASWSLYKIDATHSRLLLIDPGYVSPSKVKAKVTLQNTKPRKAIDVLTGEKIKIDQNNVTIDVPAGSMRFVDFEY